jgi:hypothetical protein
MEAEVSSGSRPYCPKCGGRLQEVDGVLACGRGQMEIASTVARMIRAEFGASGRTAATPRRLTYVLGGSWFCPRDATPMVECDGLLQCPICAGCLNEMVNALVELHPHT